MMGPIQNECLSASTCSLCRDGHKLLTLVADSDRVVGVVGTLGSSDHMSPPSSNLGASGNGDDSAVLVVDASVASHAAAADILDRVVAVGSTDTLESALAGAVDADLLEDGMARDQAGQRGKADDGGLHDG
jgi:hypothetical protein